MNILGVDPGASGGLAIVNSKTLKLVRGIRMPTYKIRGKSIVSPGGVYAFGDGVKIEVAVIEMVHAMPKQGVSSSFSFGRSTGAVEAIAHLMASRIEWVPPRAWKQHFKLSSSKQESIDAAQAMFGEGWVWHKKADDGIAEAALIARWFIDKMG